MTTTVSFDSAAYAALLSGPVMEDLIARAIRVQAAAVHLATERPGPRVRTGRLRASITWMAMRGAAPYVDIGTNVSYAYYVEMGHRNVAWGHDTGRMTPAYPFLRPALEAAR